MWQTYIGYFRNSCQRGGCDRSVGMSSASPSNPKTAGLTQVTPTHEEEGKKLPAVIVILHQLVWLAHDDYKTSCPPPQVISLVILMLYPFPLLIHLVTKCDDQFSPIKRLSKSKSKDHHSHHHQSLWRPFDILEWTKTSTSLYTCYVWQESFVF